MFTCLFPRYVHRLAASMKKKLEDAEKAMASSRLMVSGVFSACFVLEQFCVPGF